MSIGSDRVVVGFRRGSDRFRLDLQIGLNLLGISDKGFSGYEVRSLLRHQYKVEAEFADLKHVIFSITIADTEWTVNQLIHALSSLIRQKYQIND
jgi:arginine/lysine/ornithine decarboxylase